MNQEQRDGLLKRVLELCEERPDVRQQFDDLLLEAQTNHPSNSEAYDVIKKAREGLKNL